MDAFAPLSPGRGSWWPPLVCSVSKTHIVERARWNVSGERSIGRRLLVAADYCLSQSQTGVSDFF